MAIDLRGRSSVSFYDTFSAFPSTGSTTTLYVDRGDMVVYIWNGSSYEQLNNGSNITTVENYSALLAIGASNVPNMFYWCSSAQGTSWLPGPLGGTYYNSGLYYSNGTSWEYMNSPYQATQLEVDAGIVADKFVTPSTFYNSSKWDSIPTDITIGTTPITSGVAGRVLFEGAGNVVQEDSAFVWDNTNKRLGVGATPATNARLDVRAQGALSTDIGLRVRNSSDTRDIINIRGNKTIELLADTPATNGGLSITASPYNEPILNFYDNFGSKKLIIDSANFLIGLGGNGNIKIGSLTTTNSYLGLVTPSTNNRFLKLVDAFNNEYLSLGGNAYDGGGGISFTLKTTTNNNTNFITFSRSNNTNKFVVSDQANVGIGQDTFGTSAKFVLAMANATAPTTSPANCGQIYVEGGALKYRGSSGTITVLGVA